MKCLRMLSAIMIMVAPLFPASLFAQWVQTNGPYGDPVWCLAVSQNDAGGLNVLAGTEDAGIYISTNCGNGWTAVNLGGTNMNVGISCFVSSEKDLFAGIGGRVYRSTDAGRTWNPLGSRGGVCTSSLVVLGEGIFGGVCGVGVYRSTDTGATWTEVNAGLSNLRVWSLCASGGSLFCGTEDGVFCSIDNGTNWVPSGLSGETIWCFASGPDGKGGTNLFAGTYNDGIYRSSNSGITWARVGESEVNIDIRSIVVSPNGAGGSTLFAATDGGGVYVSNNDGIDWTSVNSGLTDLDVWSFAIFTDSAGRTNAFAGCAAGDIFRSTNNGASWVPVNVGLTTGAIQSFAVIPNGISGVNLVGVSGRSTCPGVFLSTDDGATWDRRELGLENTGLFSIVTSQNGLGGTDLFGASYNGVFLSTDNAASWAPVNSGLTSPYVSQLAVSHYGGATNIFAGNYNNVDNNAGGIFLSMNRGASWTPVNSGLPSNRDVLAFGVSGTNLFVSTENWRTGECGVYLSTDNGTHWAEADSGLPERRRVLALVTSNSSIYAGTDNGGVAVSSDNGKTWHLMNPSQSPSYVRGFALSGTNVFACSDLDAFLLANNGTTWTKISEGLVPGTQILDLAVSGNNLFAGTMDAGVWRRPLSDFGLPYVFTITSTAGPNGGISPSGAVGVDSGGNGQFIIAPNSGYHVDSVIVDGVRTDSTLSYTFYNVTADHTIHCTFAPYGTAIVPWTFTNTGMNHTIILDTSIHPTVSGMPLVAGDFIGVFYDSAGTPACGGYAQWNGNHAITIAAFGNELTLPAKNGFAAGEPFQWKVFRWQENREYDASATYYLPDSANPLLTSTNTYVTNGISKLRSLVAGIQDQTLALRRGWSIISSYITPESGVLDTLFEPVIPDLIILKNGQGKTYIPSIPVNSIGTWDAEEGYQLKMGDSSSILFSGLPLFPEKTPLALPTGWSILPYLRQSELAVDSGLAGIVGALIIAKDQDGKVYFPSLSINGIGTLKPGQGYQVKLSAPDTLVYPANTFLFQKHGGNHSTLVKSDLKPHYVTTVRSDNNATIIFPKKIVDGVLKKGDEVGIFDVKGVLVGSGMYDGSDFAVAVWGDDPTTTAKDGLKIGEKYTIRVWFRAASSETEVKSVEWTEGSGMYEVDGISIAGRMEVDRRDLTLPNRLELYQNYPNPFNPATSISFALPAAAKVTLKIYNVLGQVVAVLLDGNLMDGGKQEVPFDASTLASGIYYYRLTSDGVVGADGTKGESYSAVRKMVLMK